jgi:hypothetical protein
MDGAVLFVSSKGLMIATAQGVSEYLPSMNGIPRHRCQDNSIFGSGLKFYKEAINNDASTKLADKVSTEDFIEFLKDRDTYVSYVSEKNKIIIYNGRRTYVYWVDIKTRVVTKLPISIRIDNNDYPNEMYFTSDGKSISFNYNSTATQTETMFQTRPIKLDAGMKSMFRAVIRGYFKNNDPSKYAVMLVLGSYDGIHWQPIGKKVKQLAGGFTDLGCVTDRVSHKYAMIIFSAELDNDSHIEGIEVTKNNKFINKLK